MFYSLVIFLFLSFFFFSFFWNACSWALPVGLFTHFKFWACFHRRAGWKTFASLERSQMWWKIQVADIHLIHYAFHVLSRVAVSKSKWNKKKYIYDVKSTLFDLEIGRCRWLKKNIYTKSCVFFFLLLLYGCSSASRPVPDNRRDPAAGSYPKPN